MGAQREGAGEQRSAPGGSAGQPRPRENLAEGLETLKIDMNKLRGDLAALGQSLLDFGRSEMGETRGRLQEEVQRRFNSIRNALEGARGQGRDAISRASSQIEERPMVALVVAFVAGLLFGKLFDRK